jgi:predicted GNAT family N-acyltransferase
MSPAFQISKISTEQTLGLRQKVLKPFLSADQCVNPGDELVTTFHLGLFREEKLISICTFLSEPSPVFNAGNPYRLRGMATDESVRDQGFGRILLQHGMTMLRQTRCDFLWCNARQKAFNFYQTMGFFYHGELFEMDRIGPHKVMYKYLISR